MYQILWDKRKKKRRWRIQSDCLLKVKTNGLKKSKKLRGSVRQPLLVDMDELVYYWIRLKKQRVTRKAVQKKALEIYENLN